MGWEYSSTTCKRKNLHKFFGYILQERFDSSPCLLISHLFISIQSHECLFYTLVYNPMPHYLGFPPWLSGKESTGDAGDLGLVPGHGNPLQYPCLENPMDREDWWATVHRVAKSWIPLKRLSMQAHTTLSILLLTFFVALTTGIFQVAPLSFWQLSTSPFCGSFFFFFTFYNHKALQAHLVFPRLNPRISHI